MRTKRNETNIIIFEQRELSILMTQAHFLKRPPIKETINAKSFLQENLNIFFLQHTFIEIKTDRITSSFALLSKPASCA